MITPAAQRFDHLSLTLDRRRRCKAVTPAEEDMIFEQLVGLMADMTDEEIEDRMTDEIRRFR